MKLIAELNNEKHNLEFSRDGEKLLATIDDRHYQLEVSEVEPNVYLFKYNNQIYEIYAAPNGTVNIGNHQLEISLYDPKRFHGSEKTAVNHDGVSELKTAMPGKIVRILLAEGAEVAQGDGILIVEAMKMQNEMKATKGGTIKSIKVAEGDSVNAGDVLAIIE